MDDKEKKGSYKKKGAAESVKQEKKDLNKMPGDVKQMDTPPARKKGGAKYKEEGVADFKGGLHAKNTKHSESGEHLGAKRMGFTQNFGAARQNSYAQGAARVASIMSFGASKKKGAADSGHGSPVGHSHDKYISPERLESNIQGTTSADMGMDLNEVVVTANANNNNKPNKERKNPKVKSIYKQQVTGVNAPLFDKSGGYGKGGVFHSPTGYSRLNPVFRKETVKRSQKQIDRMRSRGITFKEDN